MPKISAVGLFCCNKFEETPNKKVSDLSKLKKPYFKIDLPILLHKLILAGIATQVGCRSSAKADQSAK